MAFKSFKGKFLNLNANQDDITLYINREEFEGEDDIIEGSQDEGDEDDFSSSRNDNASLTASGQKSKHKRRSKNDNQGRNFRCGCGKKYLSYPALYTHIKTKHNGTTP